MAYTGVSIVDYLNSVGQSTDYASRAKLAASKGITGYTGSAQENTQLLNMLRGGATGTPIAPPVTQPRILPQARQQSTQQPQVQPVQQQVPQPQPVPQPSPAAPVQPQPQQQGGGDTELQQLAKTDRNPIQETRYQELLRQEQAAGAQAGIPGSAFTPSPTLDLSGLYEGLYESSGIKDIESGLSENSRAYTEAVAKIKDNPYLSEATMTGRLKKLDEKFNADTTNIRNDIAMRKADIETRLNLATKQFDINSQAAQQSLSQFNSLLGMGALDNASGEDIANFTRSTGIPGSMIQSAINVSKKSKEKTPEAPETQIIQSTNDAGEVTISVVNKQTGEIVNQQSLGAVGNQQNTSGGEVKLSYAERKDQELAGNLESVAISAKNYNNLEDIINKFVRSGSGVSVEDVYRIYSSNSPFGKPEETLDQVKREIFKNQQGEVVDTK